MMKKVLFEGKLIAMTFDSFSFLVRGENRPKDTPISEPLKDFWEKDIRIIVEEQSQSEQTQTDSGGGYGLGEDWEDSEPWYIGGGKK